MTSRRNCFLPVSTVDVMHIERYMRTNTTICPGLCVSVISLETEDGPGYSMVEIYNHLLEDADSLDGLVIMSSNGDPTEIPNLHKIIVSLKPPKVQCILMCDGMHPDRIDDLLGSGYVDVINICVDRPLKREQMKCLDLVRRYNYEFMVTVDMSPDTIGLEEIRKMAGDCTGCRQFIMKPRSPNKDRNHPSDERKGYRKKDLESFMEAVKGLVKNPRMIV